jgi:hypothetical protein
MDTYTGFQISWKLLPLVVSTSHGVSRWCAAAALHVAGPTYLASGAHNTRLLAAHLGMAAPPVVVMFCSGRMVLQPASHRCPMFLRPDIRRRARHRANLDTAALVLGSASPSCGRHLHSADHHLLVVDDSFTTPLTTPPSRSFTSALHDDDGITPPLPASGRLSSR